MAERERVTPECSCKVTGPAHHQTKFDPKCPYHGDNGSMVAVVPVVGRSDSERA